MLYGIIGLSVTTVIFFILALFFGAELLKKFAFLRAYADKGGQMLSFFVEEDQERVRRMRNIVIRGNKDFVVLVGFQFPYNNLYDCYGFVESEDGVAVISTFIGKGECDFQFLIGGETPDNLSVSMTEADMALTPMAVYPPHLLQRIGLFA